MNGSQQTFRLDLDEIVVPCMTALHRAYVFAAFGVNAAKDPNQINFHLPGRFRVQFAPDSVSDKQLSEYKAEFGNWILGNALREAIEGFEISLERIFDACAWAALAARTKLPTPSDRRAFMYLGLSQRLAVLEERFGLVTLRKPHLESLMRLRNCLTHRRGMVGPEDCDRRDQQHLVVRFQRLEYVAKDLNGQEMVVPPDPPQPVMIRIDGPDDLKPRLAEVEKLFALGTTVSIEVFEIRDMLWTFDHAILELHSAIIQHFKGLGLPIKKKFRESVS